MLSCYVPSQVICILTFKNVAKILEVNFSKAIVTTSDTLSWLTNMNVQYALKSRVLDLGIVLHS